MIKTRANSLINLHCNIFAGTVGMVAFLVAFLLNVHYCTASSAIMIICGVFLYLFFAKRNKDLFGNDAVFSAVWFISIGLALLRLNVNQVPWENKTWVCLALAYVSFLFGYSIIKNNGKKEKKCEFNIKERTFFVIAVLSFLVPVGAFMWECLAIGFVPAFTGDQTAYVSFYVKGVHYFTVSIVIFSPISILYLKRFKNGISRIKTALIAVCNVVAFLIPIFIVSRQLSLLQVILCLCTVYYDIDGNKMGKMKLIAMASLIIVGLTNWTIISNLRNQDNNYLREVFDSPPVAQKVYNEDDTQKKDTKSYSSNVSTWPMTVYHPYMYISFNFDNFNYALKEIDNHAMGLYCCYPAVHMSPLVDLYDNFPTPVYNKIYNTFPIIYPAYYDLGLAGIFVYMFLIGLLSKFALSWDRKNPFYQTISYLIKFALMMCFFASFFANTAFLFYIVLLLIMSFICKMFSKSKLN